jgi:hypothetical protein
MSFQDIQPAHDGALVIRGSPSIQFPTPLGIRCKLEWLIQPTVLLERRLHIVVAVNEEGFLCIRRNHAISRQLCTERRERRFATEGTGD